MHPYEKGVRKVQVTFLKHDRISYPPKLETLSWTYVLLIKNKQTRVSVIFQMQPLWERGEQETSYFLKGPYLYIHQR